MSLTFTEARDEILTLFRTAWEAQPTPPSLFYWDVEQEDPTGEIWARITVRHNIGGNDAIGNRLFVREGVITLQIFTRFGEGLVNADATAKVAVDAFQGKSTPGGVWFRNVRYTEIGQDGEWFQSQVLADFEYTEVI